MRENFKLEERVREVIFIGGATEQFGNLVVGEGERGILRLIGESSTPTLEDTILRKKFHKAPDIF